MRGLLDKRWLYGGGPNRLLDVEDLDPPVLLFAEIGLVADNVIVVRYNDRLDETSVPAITDYTIGGTSETVASVHIDNRNVSLTLTGDVSESDTILLTYVSGANPLRDTSLNNAANLTNEAVTNNVVDSFQYIVYNNNLIITPAETIYSDGTYEVRKRIVGYAYYIDVGITPTGFDGVEDTDWTWVKKYNGQTADFRSGVRDGDFVVDCELTATGFAGVEGTDWENLMTAPGGGALTTYRDGVRDSAYVIDKELTATGFVGTEGTDWENIATNKPL